MDFPPLVSIIIPTYNRANLLPETLDTIVAQSYINWECILVDDGSQDATLEIIKSYNEQDQRIKYFVRNRLPKGPSTCRNIGIKNASGAYIIFLDSDDLLASHCLKTRIEYFNKNPKMDFLVFQIQMFNQEINDMRKVPNLLYKKSVGDLTRFIRYDYPWQTSSAIIKNNTGIERIGNWDEELNGPDDLDYYIRAIVNNCNYLKIDSMPDIYFRMGNSDKLSFRQFDKVKAKSKIKFIENTILNLKDAGLLKDYKRVIIDLVIFEFFAFLMAKKIGSYFRIVFLLLKYGILNLFSIFLFFFDIIYHHLDMGKNRVPLLFRIYHIFYGFTNPEERLKNTPPKYSTLGKYTIEEYEGSFLK